MEYHSFLCVNYKEYNGTVNMIVSVSLRSIIHSYTTDNFINLQVYKKFPSPYGVSFILMIFRNHSRNNRRWRKFPSPYGVSFILIGNVRTREEIAKVFPSPYGVSFILINMLKGLVKVGLGFRLLTEYHSFLFIKYWSNGTIKVKSFRLLTEYHSFLFLHC